MLKIINKYSTQKTEIAKMKNKKYQKWKKKEWKKKIIIFTLCSAVVNWCTTEDLSFNKTLAWKLYEAKRVFKSHSILTGTGDTTHHVRTELRNTRKIEKSNEKTKMGKEIIGLQKTDGYKFRIIVMMSTVCFLWTSL